MSYIGHASGRWMRFEDVQAAARSSIGPIKDVSTMNVNGLLH